MKEAAYQHAELRRRFNALLLKGTVTAKQSGGVIVTVSTASGDMPSPALPVLGRDLKRVSIGEPCWVMCPQGQLSQGLVTLVQADPLLESLHQQVIEIKARLA